ncbi:TonB-dependent receptor [Achromobacter insuavis]|uniref:TonB-dependent receptor n=1 Tax=Achromobacter insuavis TaxID=1287735 RepID=UPI003B9BF10D
MQFPVFITRRPRPRAVHAWGQARLAASCLLILGGLPGGGRAAALEPVVVEGRRVDEPAPAYSGGQVAAGGRLGLLGNVDLLDAPFSLTSYTSTLIEDQQAATLGDVLDNMPAVRRSVPPNNIGEQFRIRGFALSDSQTAVNGLYGLVPTYGGTPPLEIAERVEVLLGPSALLNGMAPVGGSLNIVPKRAADEPLARVTLGGESASLAKAHVDLGRRFGSGGEWGLRVNSSRRGGGTPLDGVSRKDDLGALALDYRGERLRAALDVWRSTVRNRGGTPVIPGMDASLATMPAAPDGGLTVSDDDYDAHDTTAMIGGEFDLTRDWTAFARFGTRHNDFAGRGQLVTNVRADGSAYLFPFATRADNHARSAELGARGVLWTGIVRHALVLSGARRQEEARQGFVYAPIALTNLHHPPAMRHRAPAAGEPPKTSRSTFDSVALADTLSLDDERVLLTLGARRQRVKVDNFGATLQGFTPITSTYDQRVWTPMVGLVIKPAASLSLYANHIQGLEAGTTVGRNYQNAGEVLPPYKTRQFEVGVKLDRGGFANTFSLFQITRPSTVSDRATRPLPTLRLDGEQRNRGVEWAFFGALTGRVRVLGGISHTQGRLTRTQDSADNGNDAPGTAPLAANLGLEWDVPGFAGLTLSGRVIHTGAQYIDNANTLRIASWTRWDLGARYATRVAAKTVTLRASIHNVADRRYWEGAYMSGYVSPAAPRTFLLSAAVDF